ncbi:MAG: hypothetical protein K2W78_09345 [Xanthobacteraceae bacterium]|nr:hypothetical protein [Xanthobacteraceae bacterium]
MQKPYLLLMALGVSIAGSMNGGAAVAQVFHTPGGTPVVVPRPGPPPPAITVPTVPQMASPPKFELGNTSPSLVDPNPQPQVNLKPLSRKKSFGDRVTRCLDQGAALGLGPGERSAYSRACAQQ